MPPAAPEPRGRPATRRRWVWVTGAILVAVFAVAIASRRAHVTFGVPPICDSKDSKKYSGLVEDCCCDYESVNSGNVEVLHPILKGLVTTPFFRYFKVLVSSVYMKEFKSIGLCRSTMTVSGQ